MSLKHLTTAALALAGVGLATAAHAGKTLDAVKARGQVVCGVNTSGPGFSRPTARASGRASTSTSAVPSPRRCSGDADKVKYVPLNSQQRFASLQAGEIDVLSRNSTWTLTRDASLGVVFTGINYYDGQGFMVPKKLKIDNVKKLNGATVCVQAGTTSEKNVADYFGANGMKYKSVVFDTAEAITSAFFAGRCQVYTTDMSDLAGAALKAPKPDDYLDPAAGDLEGAARAVGAPRRRRVVRDRALDPVRDARGRGERPDAGQRRRAEVGQQGPGVQRFLGVNEDTGKLLGLDAEWAYRIVKQVGNYGESFERNLGPKAPLTCRAASTTCGPRAA